ncbi:uncharacterized protein PF3D7_1120000-like [Battus philenor]|uniref:uncharacterized protein PF3D7_1120000-like n=1 Tax=Battus philenor TaxID=42288 RepID=UPI0035D13366
MEDLQQSQILDSCRLALPNGLKELMSDITREVLRARPQNLYQFIADYLHALLTAREKLSIAAQLYKDIRNSDCKPELDDELKRIGLTDEEVAQAKNIIIEYLQKDIVREEIMNICSKGISSQDNVATRAAKHTLKVYWKSNPPDKQHYPNPEQETPYWEHDENWREDNCHKTKTSSTDSSEDIFKHIKYEGGIEDLFVSRNCKPYKDCSLTSLAGSFAPHHKAYGPISHNALINSPEHVNYEDDKHACKSTRISFKLKEKQMQINTSSKENESNKEINVTDEFDDANESNEEINVNEEFDEVDESNKEINVTDEFDEVDELNEINVTDVSDIENELNEEINVTNALDEEIEVNEEIINGTEDNREVKAEVVNIKSNNNENFDLQEIESVVDEAMEADNVSDVSIR